MRRLLKALPPFRMLVPPEQREAVDAGCPATSRIGRRPRNRRPVTTVIVLLVVLLALLVLGVPYLSITYYDTFGEPRQPRNASKTGSRAGRGSHLAVAPLTISLHREPAP